MTKSDRIKLAQNCMAIIKERQIEVTVEDGIVNLTAPIRDRVGVDLLLDVSDCSDEIKQIVWGELDENS